IVTSSIEVSFSKLPVFATSAASTMITVSLGESRGGQAKKHNDDHDFLHIRPPYPLPSYGERTLAHHVAIQRPVQTPSKRFTINAHSAPRWPGCTGSVVDLGQPTTQRPHAEAQSR